MSRNVKCHEMSNVMKCQMSRNVKRHLQGPLAVVPGYSQQPVTASITISALHLSNFIHCSFLSSLSISKRIHLNHGAAFIIDDLALYYMILYHIVLYFILFHYIILHFIILYFIILYSKILNYTKILYIILCYGLLHYFIL